jgi:hypothetical protein
LNQHETLVSLERAAASGSDDDAFRYGMALVDACRMSEAQAIFLRTAEAGHVLSQIEYARMRLHGIAEAGSPEVAVRWLLRAEQSGHPAAAELLASIALGNVALPRDQAINERLYRAVQADYPPALLAAAVHFGRKANKDDQALCLQLLERAAARGGALAAVLLAERLRTGEGCAADPDMAEQLWQKLEENGVRRIPSISAPLPDATSSAPRQLGVEDVLRTPPGRTLCETPRVSVIDQLLSADECRLIVASAQSRLRASQTLDPLSGVSRDDNRRTSHDAELDPILENCALRLVQMRMAAAAGCELTQAEKLIVLRYLPGQEYLPHRDYMPSSALRHDRPFAGNRQRTICVYLNEVEAGGDTAFPELGLRIAPVPGRALVFENLTAGGKPEPRSLHAGLPVEAGEKWLATLWVRQGRYRAF